MEAADETRDVDEKQSLLADTDTEILPKKQKRPNYSSKIKVINYQTGSTQLNNIRIQLAETTNSSCKIGWGDWLWTNSSQVSTHPVPIEDKGDKKQR